MILTSSSHKLRLGNFSIAVLIAAVEKALRGDKGKKIRDRASCKVPLRYTELSNRPCSHRVPRGTDG
jgi:hypothetical protein